MTTLTRLDGFASSMNIASGFNSFHDFVAAGYRPAVDTAISVFQAVDSTAVATGYISTAGTLVIMSTKALANATLWFGGIWGV